jgi:hypothetical protein
MSLKLMSQSTPPPPPPNEGHGTSNNQVPGGGAPLANGLGILLLFSSAYGGFKIYRARKDGGAPNCLNLC